MQSLKIIIVAIVSLTAVAVNASTSAVEMKEVNKFDRQAYVGKNVELECDLRNYYDADVQWRKLEGRLSDESEELSDGRLIIYEVSKEDAGEYECFNPANGDKRRMRLVVLQAASNANNNNNNKTSKPTEKPIEHRRQIQSKYRREIDADLGGSVEIFCGFKNEANIRWRKVNGELGPHKTVYGAPDNRLALYYLAEEDEGTYECILPDGTTSLVSLKVRATKSGGINDDEFNTKTEDYSNDDQFDNLQTVFATAGTDAKLVCDLSDYTPGGDINWRKIAGFINYNSQMIENRLEIESVSSEDTGIYECSSEGLNTMKFHLIVTPRVVVNTPEPIRLDTTTPAATTRRTQPPTTTTEPEEIIELNDPVDSFVTQTIGTRVEIVCALRVPAYDTITWEKLGGDIDFSRATPYDTKLVFSSIQPADAGIYQCKSYSTRSAHRTRLSVMGEAFPKEPNMTILQADRRNDFRTYCRETEATCRNGQCIPKSVLCNGFQDCADGSDENFCGITNAGYASKCQPNEKPCRSDGKCIPKIWFCDGERECADGSDEESCTGPSPGGMCRPYEFMCKNRNQCIYKSFLCDQERDCADSSDETGCVEPKVIKPPVRELTVCLGATFRLECQATGFPVPFINWRLNWGHVCPEPRCYMVTDESGFGVLTVTDARYEDAGAYSCEAFSTKGREFAIPDAIVRIETCRTTTTTTTTPAPIFDDCVCHGHSYTCTCSNICYDCQHNTTGPHCEYCADGYRRDPTRPNDPTAFCYKDYVPEPIRTTTLPPTTTTTYIIDDCAELCHNHSECTCNNQCYKCLDNTWGERCEKCLPGFVGDATRGTPYDCVPIGGRYPAEYNQQTIHNSDRFQPYLAATTRSQAITSNGECNEFGTIQLMDGGTCKCKPGVVGAYCDQCAPKFFHLVEQKAHRKGCVSCFCNGLEVDCESSKLRYGKLAAKFNSDEVWKISDRFIENQYEVKLVDGEAIEFDRFVEYPDVEMFFLVPGKFKGNKLAAYGGYLEFELLVKGDKNGDELKRPEIRISGSHVNIVHKSDDPIELNKETKIRVQLLEDNFKRYGDNGRVDRDHLMMALSDIKIVMIRATYTSKQKSIRLSDFSLDVAATAGEDEGENNKNEEEASDNNERVAKMVEVCRCPPGYTGNSCENCADGYTRSRRGFFLGLCEAQ